MSLTQNIHLDPLNDDDPFLLSLLSTTELPNLLVQDGYGADDEAQTVKKRKVDCTGAAAGTSHPSSLSSSSSSISKALFEYLSKEEAAVIPQKSHLSAETCRFVTSRGEVRGDTLTSMERVVNVVADKISEVAYSGGNSSGGSSGASVKEECNELVPQTADDIELATIPRQTVDAVSALDTERLRHLIDTYFDESCTFGSTILGAPPIVGRDSVYKFFCKAAESTPDAVRVVRHSRVVMDETGNKVVKCKLFTTGTCIKPKGHNKDDIPDLQAWLIVQHLDDSSLSKKELASIKRSVATTNESTGSFTYLTHGAICCHLNAQQKVTHVEHHAKFLNMKPLSHDP